MPTLTIYYDPIFLEHDTGNHPECAERLVRIRQSLREQPLSVTLQWETPPAAPEEDLVLVHSPAHHDRVRRFAEEGGGMLDPDTAVSPRSYETAVKAAGAATAAAASVWKGERRRALCLVRPPGHHATRARAMGFCLFNNVAVAAAALRKHHGVERILILDWDVHHGNGTQDIFYEDPEVYYCSIHRYPFYPGTGRAAETGAGAGKGKTLNLPLPADTTPEAYRESLQRALDGPLGDFAPQFVLISAGFDAYAGDPIAGLNLQSRDYGTLTRAVVDFAEGHCDGRVVSLLEGGYNLEGLPDCLAEHVTQLAQ